MSEEQLKAFLEKVQGDTSLQEKLKAAKSAEDVTSIAKEHGHEFTADKISQLSKEELEGVSGGKNIDLGHGVFVDKVYPFLHIGGSSNPQ